MEKKRLQQLAGLIAESVSENDKKIYHEEMKNVVKAILTVWHRAKAMGIDFDSFEKDLDRHVDGAKQDLDH